MVPSNHLPEDIAEATATATQEYGPNLPDPDADLPLSLRNLTLDNVTPDARVAVSLGATTSSLTISEPEMKPARAAGEARGMFSVPQSSELAYFTMDFENANCDFFYDPSSDDIVVLNNGPSSIEIAAIMEDNTVDLNKRKTLLKNMEFTAAPGLWRIISTQESREVLADLLLLKRRHVLKVTDRLAEKESVKRRKSCYPEGPCKRRMVEDNKPVVLPVPRPGELNEMTLGEFLTHHKMLAARLNPELAKTAFPLSQLNYGEEIEITLPSRSSNPQPEEKAEAENPESASESYALQHFTDIAGSDARFYSIYLKDVGYGQCDLGSSDWRTQGNNFFRGSRKLAKQVLQDMSSALNYLHDKDIVHNNIKPSNILYRNGRAILIDFGVAFFQDSARPVSSRSSCWYAPHERLVGSHKGAPSDVFALGVSLLYFLQKIPFPEANYPTFVPGASSKGDEERYKMVKWLRSIDLKTNGLNTVGVEDLVRRALDPDPHERITSKALMELSEYQARHGSETDVEEESNSEISEEE
ncbi:hypothetical protein NM208_g11238 [Fusarium decemcellulare]|uniref:Uncharacterized protein n=1 Tax=Fusarium decemcellulare TaxID=57161 RepID=A0ACC1RV22_9HYPO|nr:hypothetical protein NM208_g11238 [Fusarium decemcellulare]